MNSKTKAHLALLGANLFYGAGFTVAKLVMPRLIAPLGFIFIRVTVVLLLFWSTYLFGKKYRTKIQKKDWGVLILGGLFGVAINQMLFFLGLNLTEPIHGALIMMSTPLLITFIAMVILKDRITWDKTLGLIMGISGAIFLMGAGKKITMTGNTAVGDLLIFLNASSYAIYLVIIKPLMQRYRPVIVIRWVFFFGFLFVLPFGYPSFTEVDWSLFTGWDYLAVAFVVICVTFLAYLWNTYALSHLTPAITGAYIYLQPVFAAIISVLATGEKITWVKVVATLLIFSGVYFVNFGVGKKKKEIVNE